MLILLCVSLYLAFILNVESFKVKVGSCGQFVLRERQLDFGGLRTEISTLLDHSDSNIFSHGLENYLKHKDFKYSILGIASSSFLSNIFSKRLRPSLVMGMGKAISDTTGKNNDISSKIVDLGIVAELIHSATLIHDDIIDESDMRRGKPSLHKQYSTKVAVLTGDFLLAKSSIMMAQLGDIRVVESMSSALQSLVEGEMLQAKLSGNHSLDIDMYLRKSYLKTASLMQKSLVSAGYLCGLEQESELLAACRNFGHHYGVAFQLVDDLMDYIGLTEEVGKPKFMDLSQDIFTGPVIFAAQENPQILELIRDHQTRNCSGTEYLDLIPLIEGSQGYQRTLDLAIDEANRAIEALQLFPASSSGKQRLVSLTNHIFSKIRSIAP